MKLQKTVFFKGVISGEHVHIDVQIDTFLCYTKYMKQMKSLDSHGYEIVKNAVLARTLVAEDVLSIKDISYLLGIYFLYFLSISRPYERCSDYIVRSLAWTVS